MPSVKAAENPKKEESLINVVAVRTFAIDYTSAELIELKKKDREHRSQKGMCRNILPDETAFIPKEMAQKLQDAGAIKIKL